MVVDSNLYPKADGNNNQILSLLSCYFSCQVLITNVLLLNMIFKHKETRLHKSNRTHFVLLGIAVIKV